MQQKVPLSPALLGGCILMVEEGSLVLMALEHRLKREGCRMGPVPRETKAPARQPLNVDAQTCGAKDEKLSATAKKIAFQSLSFSSSGRSSKGCRGEYQHEWATAFQKNHKSPGSGKWKPETQARGPA